jgi:small subunit ribosomal protein S1
MTNELTQDAEESTATEKTAIEQSEAAAATAEAAVPQPEAIEPAQAPEHQGTEPQPNDAADPAPAAASADAENATTTEGEATPSAPAADASPTAADSAPAAAPQTAPAAPRRITVPRASAPQPPAPEPAPQPRAAASTPDAQDDASASNDIDFGAILEQFEQEQTVFHPGELVEGTVVGISDRGVLVDFGYKSEGLVPIEEFAGPDGQPTVTVGQKVEVVIRSMHSGDSAPLLSHTDALGRKVWDEIENAFQSETPVTGKIVDKTKGGLKVEINGIEAFLPGSQIDSRPIRSLDSYIGQDIEAKIIKFSRRRNNIVLSRKVLTDEVVNAEKAATLSRIDVGYVVEGPIKNLTEYGAFVDIGGIDGLLHVTDMSWGRIHHPSDQFNVGDHIQVKVLKLDREKEKVSLGYKQLLPDPWSTVVEVYPVNTKITGTVSSVTDYGVFVELEPGVEGLVHVSEVSWSRRAPSPKRLFQKGQEVEVQVLGVDTVEKRISLGMKQFLENPWDRVHERYPIGSKVHGRVRNLTDFGAFVELEEGIDGLVHVSDISWAKKIKHPKDVLKKDQEVDAIVTSIDRNGQRLSLSMKDLTPSAWEGFVATHRPGDVVRGKVSRFTNFGVFVELGEGLEGLCHISELSDERVERPEDVAQLGQEMDFKILRIEPGEQKIGLSHRSIGKGEEPAAETKMYSSEAKGGMASLGELANLKFGAGGEAPAEEDPEEKKRQKKAAKKAKAEEFAAREAEAQKVAEAPEETPTEGAETTSEEAAAADETPVAEAPAEEPSAEETPADETPAGETPAEDVPVEEAAAEPVAAEETPATESTETATEATAAEEALPAEAKAEEEIAASEPPEATAEEAPVAADEEPGETPVGEKVEDTPPAAEVEDTPAEQSAEAADQADGASSDEPEAEGVETKSAGE